MCDNTCAFVAVVVCDNDRNCPDVGRTFCKSQMNSDVQLFETVNERDHRFQLHRDSRSPPQQILISCSTQKNFHRYATATWAQAPTQLKRREYTSEPTKLYSCVSVNAQTVQRSSATFLHYKRRRCAKRIGLWVSEWMSCGYTWQQFSPCDSNITFLS